MNLRIMSYNIQHGHLHLCGGIDLSKTCDVIRQYNPDIVALNEVRGRGTHSEYTAQAEYMAANLGYHCFFGRSLCIGGSNPYGNAVLSKYPIVDARIIPIPNPVSKAVEQRSISRCTIEILDDGHIAPFAVYVTHFGLTEPEHEHAVSTLLTVLGSERLPFALMGDFNMIPENPMLAPLNQMLRGTDGKLSGQLSFPSDNPQKKLDYIFVSNNIEVIYAEIPQIAVSDHCPIFADIQLYL